MLRFTLPILLLLCGPASAELEVYFGEDLGLGGSQRLTDYPNASSAFASFLAELDLHVMVDLESASPGAIESLVLDLDILGTATVTGQGCSITNLPSGTAAGTYPLSGDQYFFSALAVGHPVVPYTIVFSDPQRAFGVFATDIGDIGASVTITLDSGHDVTVPATIGCPSGGVLFFGIITRDQFFSAITVQPLLSYDGAGYDDFSFGIPKQSVHTSMTTWGRIKGLFQVR